MKAQIMNKYHLGAVSFLYTVSVTPRTGQRKIVSPTGLVDGSGKEERDHY